MVKNEELSICLLFEQRQPILPGAIKSWILCVNTPAYSLGSANISFYLVSISPSFQTLIWMIKTAVM